MFQQRGYHNTSLSDLVEGMGLTKGSIYKAFHDKRSIFLAAYERYSERRNLALRAAVAKAGNGLECLRAALLFYAEGAAGEEGRRGCLVTATASELSLVDDEIAARVRASLARSEAFFAELIARGRADGSIAESVDARQAARYLVCLQHGMRVVGKTGSTRAQTRAVVEMALAAFE